MGCLIAFRLCRSRVLALAVALLAFFVSQGWATCSTVTNIVSVSYACDGGKFRSEYYRNRCEQVCITYKAQLGNKCFITDCPFCPNGTMVSAQYHQTCCSTVCEAEEAACLARGDNWDPSGSGCGTCNKDCKNRACCDSVAVNAPVKTDTTWEGCVPDRAYAGESQGCVAFSSSLTPGDTTIGATCDGSSQYRVCTQQYMWSESAKQCAPIMTNNCVTFTQKDSMCTDVTCYYTQQHALSSLDYDHLTMCYSGTETVQKILVCDNGIREDGGSYTRPWKVCQPYLDSIGSDISDYIAGRSGYSGTGYSAGGGSCAVRRWRSRFVKGNPHSSSQRQTHLR